MKIYYKAQNRKLLVEAISEFTGAESVYMRTPTYSYQIDYFTVDKDGNLNFDDRADSKEIEELIGEEAFHCMRREKFSLRERVRIEQKVFNSLRKLDALQELNFII